MLKKILFIVLIASLLKAQEFIIKTQHLSQSQGPMVSDSLKLIGALGASLSNNGSNESLSLNSGFLSAINGLYKKPPSLETEISNKISKDADSVIVQAITQDVNGIISANLYVQIGGEEDIIEIPMVALNDSVYQASIPDSLLSIKNFRSWVVSVDGMYFDAVSEFDTPSLEFGQDQLRMDDSTMVSRFPKGVQKDIWRMVSWPAELIDSSLKNSSLKNRGKPFVFYDRDPNTGKLTKPESIVAGRAYWFKHQYAENVIFTNHNTDGTAVPLEDYDISLKEGWNMIGSPFSFPVSVKEYDGNPNPLYTYGYDDSTNSDGWVEPTSTLYPWSGYAVHAKEAGVLTLEPFPSNLEESRDAGRTISNEWVLNLKLRSDNYVDYSSQIGRKEFGEEDKDNLDVPALPAMESFVAVRTEINGNGKFEYGSDIRSLDEMNGVWNIKLISEGISGPYTFSIGSKDNLPLGLSFAFLDVPNKNVISNILSESITIQESLGNGYDITIVSGDEQYVSDMITNILEAIPAEYSLSQNYPNPFNPTTKIDFSLPRSDDVTVTIYNLMGQQIKVLMNSNLEYGYHTVTWNGLDQLGRPVASGVYFSELRTRNFRKTKKMLLLK
ncbi:MAG: T9SS type A sorting domain-containing protein [Candidatus Neomarinimicrobiota bacterium]